MTLAESLANYLAVRGVDLDPGCPTTQQDVQAQSTYVLAEADELQDAVATWLAAGGRPDGDMNLQAVRHEIAARAASVQLCTRSGC